METLGTLQLPKLLHTFLIRRKKKLSPFMHSSIFGRVIITSYVSVPFTLLCIVTNERLCENSCHNARFTQPHIEKFAQFVDKLLSALTQPSDVHSSRGTILKQLCSPNVSLLESYILFHFCSCGSLMCRPSLYSDATLAGNDNPEQTFRFANL